MTEIPDYPVLNRIPYTDQEKSTQIYLRGLADSWRAYQSGDTPPSLPPRVKRLTDAHITWMRAIYELIWFGWDPLVKACPELAESSPGALFRGIADTLNLSLIEPDCQPRYILQILLVGSESKGSGSTAFRAQRAAARAALPAINQSEFALSVGQIVTELKRRTRGSSVLKSKIKHFQQSEKLMAKEISRMLRDPIFSEKRLKSG